MNEKEAIKRIIDEVLAKNELTQHDIDVLLKAMAIGQQFDRTETDREKIKTEAETARYTADRRIEESKIKANSERYRGQCDTHSARIKARSDERAYKRQFWSNVIQTAGTIGGTVLTTAAVVGMFKSGMRFEQNGIFTAQTTKQILANGLGLIKRR